MKNSGWIKFHRKFNEWEWYQDPKMVQFFVHLLIHANIESKQWKNWTIPAGSLVIGRLRAAAILGTSEQSVRTCIDRLKKSGSITTISTNKFTLITIVDWEFYQSGRKPSTNKQPPRQPTNNHELANKKPTRNQPSTTIKESKNINININKEEKKPETQFPAACFETYEKIISFFPLDNIPKKSDSWMKVLDQLHRLDGYEWNEIVDVLKWARSHEFWKTNCLSVLPLRKKSQNTGVSKFQTMIEKYKNEINTTQNGKDRKTIQENPTGNKQRSKSDF